MRNRSSLVIQIVFFFPEEIWYEILSWLGIKSLLRCKSVCKKWYAIIKTTQFVEMHAIRNGHRFCNINRGNKLRNSDGTEEEIMHLSISSRGLLLVRKLTFASASRLYATPSVTYQISNPTTKRVLDLPCPHDPVQTMFVFLNSSTSSYNVVSVYIDEEDMNNKLEVIDLGGQSDDSCPNADLSWRTLNISEFDNFSREQRYFFRYCMSSEGVFYILALQTGQASNPMIICADLVNKTCTTLNAPQSLCFEWHKVSFQLWRGQPSLKFNLEERLNVWMLEDYKKQKWADPIVIPMPFLKQNPLIYHVDEEEYLVYQKDNISNSVYNLVPATLVSVKGMQWRRMNPGTKYIKFGRQRHVLVKKDFPHI